MTDMDELAPLQESLKQILHGIRISVALRNEQSLQKAVSDGAVANVVTELKNVQKSVSYYAPLGTDLASIKRTEAARKENEILRAICHSNR